jgi:hypothetical protein
VEGFQIQGEDDTEFWFRYCEKITGVSKYFETFALGELTYPEYLEYRRN